MSIKTIIKQGRGGRYRWRDTLEGRTVAQGPVSGNATEAECRAARHDYEATIKHAESNAVAYFKKKLAEAEGFIETLKADVAQGIGKIKAGEAELARVLNRSWLLVVVGLVVGAAAGAAVMSFLG